MYSDMICLFNISLALHFGQTLSLILTYSGVTMAKKVAYFIE